MIIYECRICKETFLTTVKIQKHKVLFLKKPLKAKLSKYSHIFPYFPEWMQITHGKLSQLKLSTF